MSARDVRIGTPVTCFPGVLKANLSPDPFLRQKNGGPGSYIEFPNVKSESYL